MGPRSGPKVWTFPDKVVLTKRIIMKIVFVLDEWGLDWTRTCNFDETSCLEPDWQSRLVVERQEPEAAVSEANETGGH